MSRVRVPEGVPGVHIRVDVGSPECVKERVCSENPKAAEEQRSGVEARRKTGETEWSLLPGRNPNESSAKRVSFGRGGATEWSGCPAQDGRNGMEFAPTTWPVGQVVKTAASHAANRSSTLLRVTTEKDLLFRKVYDILSAEEGGKERNESLFFAYFLLRRK